MAERQAGLVVRTADGLVTLHPDAIVLDVSDSGLLQIFAPGGAWVASYAPGVWISVVAEDGDLDEHR